jgi:hypothetical protein
VLRVEWEDQVESLNSSLRHEHSSLSGALRHQARLRTADSVVGTGRQDGCLGAGEGNPHPQPVESREEE